MNNDVAGNVNNHINPKKISPKVQQNNGLEKKDIHLEEISSESCYADSLNVLGAMGKAQVNLSKPAVSDSVRKSTEEFMQNPELVQAKVDFQDWLVERGYAPIEVLDKTDDIFGILKQKSTYD